MTDSQYSQSLQQLEVLENLIIPLHFQVHGASDQHVKSWVGYDYIFNF